MNTTDKLVRMANQIADYFAAYPEDEAEAGVRDHIEAFWTPRMIATLRERASADPTGLRQLAAAAILNPPRAENPAEKAVEGPKELGAITSDAG